MTTMNISAEGDKRQFSICFVALHASSLFSDSTAFNMVGGAEVQQYLIGNELASRNVVVKFVIKDDSSVTKKRVGSIQLQKAFDPTQGIRFVRGIYPQFIKLWCELVKADCDAYYVRGAKYESGITWLFCKVKKRIMIQSLAHDYDCSLETLHNLKGWMKKRLYLQALNGANLVLAQTTTQQELLKSNLNISSEVFPNVMNIARNLNDQPSRCVKRLLWVATIKPIKQPYLYLELAKNFPGLSFTMIGPMSDKFVAYRREFIAKAEKVNNLQFVEYVPLVDIENYFREADLFVSTSEREGFPNVFLQAWAHGKPVLSFVDPDTVIKRNSLGWVVANMREMTLAIEQASSDEWSEMLNQIATNAVNYVRTTHATGMIVDQMIEKIWQLLERNYSVVGTGYERN